MAVLVDKSVRRTLFSMAFPMLAGTFAMNAYNLTDTWFVSRLGTLPLAAMGFTFPVVALLTCVAGGIGSGVTTLTSHAIGRHDHPDASRIVCHGLLLTISVAAAMSVAGYFLITPTFQRLGADDRTLPLIGQYMRTWYIGAVSMALPMTGNGILISCGDSKSAARFMILGTGLNVILDPIMIFGYLGCPAMGIRGAALATVLAQSISTLWLLYLLSAKHRLLTFGSMNLRHYTASLKRIAGFAVPGVLTLILIPISATVITRIISQFGYQAVAAAGAAGRIEMFAFMVPMALGMSLTPFVSQNFGAGRIDRVIQAHKATTQFALGYGGLTAIVFFLCAPWMAMAFTRDPKVDAVLISYIRIISFGYGMMEVTRYCGFFLTGLHRPAFTTILHAVRVLVLLIPLSFIGARWMGIAGVFWGRLITDLLAGTIGLIWVWRILHLVQSSKRDTADQTDIFPKKPVKVSQYV